MAGPKDTKQIEVNPGAELEPRPDDVPLAPEHYARISLFANLKQKPSLVKFPGSLVLRRYRKNEVICRQGEPGWTAFYLLTSADALAVIKIRLEAGAAGSEKTALEQARAELERVESAGAMDSERRRAATAFLSLPRKTPPRLNGWLDWLNAAVFAKPQPTSAVHRRFIPIDAPQDLDYDTQEAPLYEGDVFGEMSCLYRTPRSATIVAQEDCYVLEFLRNILDHIQRDPAHKARMDALYKKRVLELHLRNLPIFDSLTAQQTEQIRDAVELVNYGPDQVIFDEHDPSDSLYIIRNGVVKVVKFVSELLGVQDVTDWARLSDSLRAGGAAPAGPQGAVWNVLPEPLQARIKESGIAADHRQEVLYALNDRVIKNRAFADAEGVKALLAATPLGSRVAALLEQRQALQKSKSDWGEPDLRRFNRMMLEAIFPAALRSREAMLGPETVVAYLSRGDYFGEMGVMTGQPRSATCVTYSHPNNLGQIELVRIKAETFQKILEVSSPLKEAVSREIARRSAGTAAAIRTSRWDERQQLQHSDRFEELGLIQGQRLMLIDLDRCTRCDECVKACVDSHDDGRSRLFLDGPRLGKYLVPTTCRSCLDPVCMINCPVGSIHRGNNREIVIEDWCIGCGLCARQCPYGAIQMHDVGIIPDTGYGWRYLPSDLAGEHWASPSLRVSGWLTGKTPFTYDQDLRAALEECYRAAGRAAPAEPSSLCFRYDFALDGAILKSGNQFRIELITSDSQPQVYLNGAEVKAEGEPKRGVREYPIPSPDKTLRPGRNVLAIRVAQPGKGDSRGVLLQARLDEARPPRVALGLAADISEKLVTELAVVCDLCSNNYRKVPACVNACPHDAAMRVDARSDFPAR